MPVNKKELEKWAACYPEEHNCSLFALAYAKKHDLKFFYCKESNAGKKITVDDMRKFHKACTCELCGTTETLGGDLTVVSDCEKCKKHICDYCRAVDHGSVVDDVLCQKCYDEDNKKEKCWTCGATGKLHKVYREALGETELTCAICHRNEYPEEYEDSNVDIKITLDDMPCELCGATTHEGDLTFVSDCEKCKKHICDDCRAVDNGGYVVVDVLCRRCYGEVKGKCGKCGILLDGTRDGTIEDGHRCNNCYWEDEGYTAGFRKPSPIISPDYRPPRSPTKNIKGDRQIVYATYKFDKVFKIPYDLDLEDKTVVEAWGVRYGNLWIRYTNGNLETIDAYEEFEPDYKCPFETGIQSAQDREIHYSDDSSESEDED